jgi:hypothetical protein
MEPGMTRKWLLTCLNYTSDDQKWPRLAQLSEADWEEVKKLAVEQRLAPLLYDRLKVHRLLATLPASVQQQLQRRYRFNAHRNLRLYKQLLRLLKYLNRADIPVIVLKGAHIANFVYENITLRTMSDVDLLVKQADVPQVEEILQQMDYVLDIRQDKSWYVENHYHFHYAPLNEGIYVEIHWHIQCSTSPFTLDLDELWQRAQPATIAGVEMLVFSPEYLLLHLSMHISMHEYGYSGLRSLCDISETIRHYQNEIDWKEVYSRTRQWNAAKAVYLSLYLAQDWLGAAVPNEVLDRLKPTGFEFSIVPLVNQRIFNDNNAPPNELSTYFTQLWDSKRGPDKITNLLTLLTRIFLPPEAMAQKYSLSPDSKLIYLYYPVRLKDLLIRYSRVSWQLLRRDEEAKACVDDINELVDLKATLKEWFASG